MTGPWSERLAAFSRAALSFYDDFGERPTPVPVLKDRSVWQHRRLLLLDSHDRARPMANEFELKLELSSDAAERAATLPWLRELASGPVRKEKLTSVYFDTVKRKLHDHGLSLRVRRLGDRRVQTIKVESNSRRGAFGRDEWEQDIACDQPDLGLAADTALAKLANGKLKRKLRPVFETVIERTTIPMRCDETALDFAVDRGLIHGGGRRQPVNEIEIEIKEGDPSAVATIAERLARSVPVRYGVRSKAERGYALCGDETTQPVHAAPISLDPSATAGEAFTAIGLSCLKQVLSNREAVIHGEAEGIHQMRVGLRRLRAAISIFKRLLGDVGTATMKRELRWLTDELGPAREYEVLIAEQVAPLRQAEPETGELRTLNKELQERRERALRRARNAVESDRFRELGLYAALWLANGAWSRDDDPLAHAHRGQPAADFAVDVLARRSRKILRKLDDLDRLTPPRRHKLRIAIKKLRYASDFFAGLFNARKQKSRRKVFRKILKTMQGSLGTLNDVAMHRQVAKSVVHLDCPIENTAEQAFAMGFVTGAERSQIETCLARAMQAGRGLAAARPFWR
jgi:inorganic triphosphatase YgiF